MSQKQNQTNKKWIRLLNRLRITFFINSQRQQQHQQRDHGCKLSMEKCLIKWSIFSLKLAQSVYLFGRPVLFQHFFSLFFVLVISQATSQHSPLICVAVSSASVCVCVHVCFYSIPLSKHCVHAHNIAKKITISMEYADSMFEVWGERVQMGNMLTAWKSKYDVMIS